MPKISTYPSATALDGTEKILGNQSAATVTMTPAQVKTYLAVSGTNTGDVTLGAVGSSPSANAATLSGQALTLQPADATHPGVLTTGTQAIAGIKQFSSPPTVPDAVGATDAVNLETMQTYLAALDSKGACAYASTSALPANTYANGSSGVGATLTGNANGPLVIDSVTLVVGNVGLRILVAGEAATANNGWYTLTQVGVVAVSPYILTRATDSDQAAEIGPGYLTGVDAPTALTPGTANNGKVFISASPSPFVVGTSALTFSAIGGTYTNGTGLSLTGSTFSTNFGTTSTTSCVGNDPRLTTDVQVFTLTSQSPWVKPTTFTPKTVIVVMYGAGGGGGAGASLATSVVAKGGGGGGGGAYNMKVFQASDLGSNESLVVGVGGPIGSNGGAGAAGGDGTGGTASTFGTTVRMTAGGGGGGNGGAISAVTTGGGGGGGTIGSGGTGTTAAGIAGTPGTGVGVGGSGATGGAGGGAGGAAENGGAGGGSASSSGATGLGGSSVAGGGGGGQGGCHNSTPAIIAGKAGGATNSNTAGGGGAVGTDGASPTKGTDGTAGDSGRAGTGGGGGGTTITASTNGGAGGAGGANGGGGGGGGVGQNPGLGGNGGIGGAGAIYVYSFA